MDQVRSVTGFVSGRVQGVGFRYFVMRHAQAENLGGFVRNLDDGRVQFLLQGEAELDMVDLPALGSLSVRHGVVGRHAVSHADRWIVRGDQ